MAALERAERASDLGLTSRAVVTLGLPRGARRGGRVVDGGGLENRSGLDRSLANRAQSCGLRLKSFDRHSVPTCPDLPFADTITAQFAAPAALADRELLGTCRAALSLKAPSPLNVSQENRVMAAARLRFA